MDKMVKQITTLLKTVQFKDFIPVNGVGGSNKVTLHFKARKRFAVTIAKYILECKPKDKYLYQGALKEWQGNMEKEK